MNPRKLNSFQVGTLEALANGIIPRDDRDGGAAEVEAARKIAGKIESGVNSALYYRGLEKANSSAEEAFSRLVNQLTVAEIHQLLGMLRESEPGFFKQLRMDVSAIYLSDATVWQRIGFPGPSTESEGYPDFDQPQSSQS